MDMQVNSIVAAIRIVLWKKKHIRYRTKSNLSGLKKRLRLKE